MEESTLSSSTTRLNKPIPAPIIAISLCVLAPIIELLSLQAIDTLKLSEVELVALSALRLILLYACVIYSSLLLRRSLRENAENPKLLQLFRASAWVVALLYLALFTLFDTTLYNFYGSTRDEARLIQEFVGEFLKQLSL